MADEQENNSILQETLTEALDILRYGIRRLETRSANSEIVTLRQLANLVEQLATFPAIRIINHQQFRYDPFKNQIIIDDQEPVPLRPQENVVWKALWSNVGRPLSAEDLQEIMYPQSGFISESNVVAVQIRRLRELVGDGDLKEPLRVKTLRGAGYYLNVTED